jgi:hypothetical protein
MATATRNQGKSSFVKDFFLDHPEGNVKAVNAAWLAAGNKGKIGDTIIYKMRADMGLSGNVRQKKISKIARGKSATSSRTPARTGLGKSSFVKEFLNDNPQGNVKAANEAWLKAGMTGTISSALVNKMRASLGLTGNLRAKSKPPATTTGKNLGRPPKRATAPVIEKRASSPPPAKSDRTSALLNVEAEIDRLIFTVMGIGNLSEIESALRDARRRIYGALTS